MKRAGNEIGIAKIKVRDPFWSPMQQLVTDVVIPYQEKTLNDEIPGVAKSHAIENFRIAAGMSDDEYYGMVFQDSDLAKWLEGAAYSLAVKPDQDLERRVDEIIDIIEKAQQEDGYLNTFFTVKEPEHRWQNLLECHELYCAGHMMEAGAAYYEATGKEKLLRVMERMADHIARRFGPDKEPGIPGHQEIEIGLMKLYRVTGKKQYQDLARYFIDERGKNPNYFREEFDKRGWVHFEGTGMYPDNTEYNQSHTTVYDQKDAVGHSVRAVYMYTAMADLAGTQQDEKLYAACKTLWDSIVKRRMYITGGIGSTVEGEAFSIDYDLPNDTVYAETCASIGLVFFAKKMLDIEADGNVADVMEKALYNGIISGMQLDGKRFFYVNPLEVNPGVSGELFGHKHVLPERPGWYECACCPPNVVRLLASLGKYAWTEDEETIYSHLYIGQEAELEKAKVTVKSSYPWEGEISYHVAAREEKEFTFAVHIPAHAKDVLVKVNGDRFAVDENLKNGYLYITRVWGAEDTVELSFAMPVRKVYANPKVRHDAGCTALLRGPVVYCFEGVDNGEDLQSLRIPEELKVETEYCSDGVLKGNVLLHMNGYKVTGMEDLYTEKKPGMIPLELTAVPYYTWGNRGLNQMRVWMPEE